MATIIELFKDPHRSTQELLPWYVTGKLDAEDRAKVDTHLAGCAACRDELAAEHTLAALVADVPIAADNGWDELRRSLSSTSELPRRSRQQRTFGGRQFALPGKFGWLIAGQAAVAMLAVAALLSPGGLVPYGAPVNVPDADRQATYRTLGSPDDKRVGNAIVIFRPDASEAAIRQMLNDGHARLVDGPTEAGAYVLQIAPSERDASIAALGLKPDVVLAQPLDSPLSREAGR